MRTLFLARHAHAISNEEVVASGAVPGEGLTPEGVAQARRLAGAIRGEKIDLGVSSELLRTQETLSLALGSRDIATIVVPELDEIDFGGFDGGSLEAYRAWAAAADPAEPAPGGGESRAGAAARYARGVRQVLERSEEAAFVVGHALCIRYVVDAARGLVPAPLMKPIEHVVPYRLDAEEVLAAAALLEEWSRAPVFRPLPFRAQLSDD